MTVLHVWPVTAASRASNSWLRASSSSVTVTRCRCRQSAASSRMVSTGGRSSWWNLVRLQQLPGGIVAGLDQQAHRLLDQFGAGDGVAVDQRPAGGNADGVLQFV